MKFFNHLFSVFLNGTAGHIHKYGHAVVNHCERTVVEVGNGITLCTNIVRFLNLQSAFKGEGIVNTSRKNEALVHKSVSLGEFRYLVVLCKNLFNVCGNGLKRFQTVFVARPHAGEIRKYVKLRPESLCRGNALLFARVAVKVIVSRVRKQRAERVCYGQGNGSACLCLLDNFVYVRCRTRL